ncbi:MAG: hypothetical protein JW932_08950 [Deltaproteobacteria bacterium]|nr:hypothetical protein [Deltaproteobacteria bacterium]
MRLRSTDRLKVLNHSLSVNGKPFKVQYPDEPLCCVEHGKLVTLVIKGCGCSLTYWDPEEVEGNYV